MFFSTALWLRRLGKSAFAKIRTPLWRESGLEVKFLKDWHVRMTFCNSDLQNLHHALARESDLEARNRTILACSGHFLKVKFLKFAPR